MENHPGGETIQCLPRLIVLVAILVSTPRLCLTLLHRHPMNGNGKEGSSSGLVPVVWNLHDVWIVFSGDLYLFFFFFFPTLLYFLF